jgi:hypothetical protein
MVLMKRQDYYSHREHRGHRDINKMDNELIENSKNIIDGNCWVSYFDILGFRKLTENFPTWYIRDVLKQALDTGKSSNIKCKFVFFSDSFIFYTDNDSQESFSCIEATSSLFFHEMFRGRERIPMRGCLNIGRFCADEENRFFFGPALIEAYDCAEGQNWIGFVLSEKVRKKLESPEFANIKSGYKDRFVEYSVPYKEPKSRNLLAYNLNLLTTIGNTEQAKNEQYQLWMALDHMKYVAQILSAKKGNQGADIEKCFNNEAIITKYDNTEKFMFCIYPALKELIENKKQVKI